MNKKTLIIVAMILSVLVTVASGLFVASRIQARLKDNLVGQYSQQELALAQQTARLLELEVSNLQEKLTLIAQIPEVKEAQTDVCMAKLDELFQVMRTKIGNLGRVNEEGLFACSLNKALIGVKGATLGKYIEDIFSDPEHKPVLSRLFKPPGIPGYIVALHVPVRNDAGEFIGTIGGALYFDELQSKILKNIKIGNTGYISLVDDNFDLLYHPQLGGKNLFSEEVQTLTHSNEDLNGLIKEGLQGKSGIARYIFNEDEKIAGYFPAQVMPDRRWLVIVTIPVGEIQSIVVNPGVDSSFEFLYVLIAVAIVCPALLLLFIIIRSIFAPLDLLEKSMQRVIEGDFSAGVPVQSKDEMGRLATVFNAMIAKLKDSYTSLERKVSERTEELTKSKDSLESGVRERTRELESIKENLEKTVAERTEALQKQLDETERINQAMVGRELAMSEMKKELEELRKQK